MSNFYNVVVTVRADDERQAEQEVIDGLLAQGSVALDTAVTRIKEEDVIAELQDVCDEHADDDDRWILIEKGSLLRIRIGDTLQVDGDDCTVQYLHPPHKPGAQGKVQVYNVDRGYEATWYASVLDARFVCVYDNCKRNEKRVGWTAVPEYCYGPKDASLVLHDVIAGEFHFMNEVPELRHVPDGDELIQRHCGFAVALEEQQ